MHKPPGLTAAIAGIRCNHGSLQDQPCARCLSTALRDVRELGDALIEHAARLLMSLNGYTGKPTPLTYAAAVALLKGLLPAVNPEHLKGAPPS